MEKQVFLTYFYVESNSFSTKTGTSLNFEINVKFFFFTENRIFFKITFYTWRYNGFKIRDNLLYVWEFNFTSNSQIAGPLVYKYKSKIWENVSPQKMVSHKMIPGKICPHQNFLTETFPLAK